MTPKSFAHVRKSVCMIALVAFMLNLIAPTLSFAQTMNLPVPGTMVMPSTGYTPALIRGITINPSNPLQFNFIVDTGHSGLEGEPLEQESSKLIKYFLASLTVPEDELWVNLSPYEKERIASESFGRTEMGRDLLGQDYILKQLTSSLLYPESQLGKEFWSRVYKKAQAKFGKIDIPVNTFNKVWIVPEDAVVYEHENSAFVVKSRLKVMLEEDYVALKENPQLKAAIEKSQALNSQSKELNELGSQVVREVIIPEIEKEVNEGENFASLRQIYNSMILAAWFKNTLKQSLLGQVYVDKNKVLGVDSDDPDVKEKIYQQYLEAYTKGVYNYIKEEVDPVTEDVIPRKYFSGGFMGGDLNAKVASSTVRGVAPDVVPTGKIVSVSTSLVENPPAATEQVRNPGWKSVIAGLMLAGIAILSPDNATAVTQQTTAIYAKNQAANKTPVTIAQAEKDLDVNLDLMLTKFKADKRVNTAVPAWLRPMIKSAKTFQEFSQQVSQTLKAETDKQKLTTLQKDVLRAVYVFMQANTVFDLYGQVMDSPGVGSYRNFIVGDPKYPSKRRTIICQTATEFNLALLTYEFGFNPDQVTAIEVLVNFEGSNMLKNGGHSSNLIKFPNGETLIYDIIQGTPANLGLGVAHKVIVVKGDNGKVEINLEKQTPTQALKDGLRGNTVAELEVYQDFELTFVRQLNDLFSRQGSILDLILAKKYQEAIDQYKVLKVDLQRLFDDPMFKTYILEVYSKNFTTLKEMIDANLAKLESDLQKQQSAAPASQPASQLVSTPVPSAESSLNGQDNVGGINLNPTLLNLQIKRDDNGVPLPVMQQPIGNMNIQGFYPVIINITPVNNLSILLGANK